MASPYYVTFNSFSEPGEGFLVTTQQAADLPFAVKRIFWTLDTPASVVRGQHAHWHTELVLVNLKGNATIELENQAGEVQTFVLDSPTKGLYLPVMHWSRIYLQPEAVLLCLASTDYEEADYIRDYEAFKAVSKQ